MNIIYEQVSLFDLPTQSTSNTPKLTLVPTKPNIIKFPSRNTSHPIKPISPRFSDKPLISHKTQPIKSQEQRDLIKQALLASSKNPKLAARNYLIWIVGCNIGRRARDLLSLRLGDVINFSNNTVKQEILLREQKTKKVARIGFSPSVEEAILNYFNSLSPSERIPTAPLFPSRKQSPKTTEGDVVYTLDPTTQRYIPRTNSEGEILHRTLLRNTDGCLEPRSYARILREINKTLAISDCLGTHTMRKTHAYTTMQYFEEHKNEYGVNGLDVVQMSLNHSSQRQTLDYLGITEEIKMQSFRIER